MGQLLKLTLLHSVDFLNDLKWLQENHGVTSYATSLQEGSLPLECVRRNGPALIIVGNERHGLPSDIQAAASQRIRIDMEMGTDSLNVGIAAAIFMHYFCRCA